MKRLCLSSDQIIQENKKNFWGWYLGAITLAFLKETSSFHFYLESAKKRYSLTLITYVILKPINSYLRIKNQTP